MRRPGKGFTILEVIVALAITSFLLVAAGALLQGQSADTTFQQATRDIDSKLRSVISTVSNGIVPNSDKYTCQSQGTPAVPTLTLAAGGGLGTNDQCVFLGRAVKVTTNSGTILIYSVLGNRTYTDGNGNVQPVDTYERALPTPAFQLNDSFTPSINGANLKSATYTDVSGNTVTSPTAELAGFYLDPKGSSTTQSQLLAKAYQTSGNQSQNQITVCLSEQTPTLVLSGTVPCNKTQISHWLLCYVGGNGDKTAQIDVVVEPTGVTTRLNYKTC